MKPRPASTNTLFLAIDYVARAPLILNTVSNAAGMAVTLATQATLMLTAFHFLTAEEYGLFGLFGTVLLVASMLDSGIGQTVVREISSSRRVQVSSESFWTTGDILFTFQFVYLFISLGLVFMSLIASPLISNHWLKATRLDKSTVAIDLIAMTGAIAAQRMRGIYQSTLDGLESQSFTNLIYSLGNALRILLGLSVLLLVSESALGFFCSQILAGTIETVMFCVVCWRLVLPVSKQKPKFRWELLSETRIYSLVNSGATGVGLLVQAADSMVISGYLPLAELGLYAFAVNASAIIPRLTTPIYGALFPRFVLYIRDQKWCELSLLYTLAVQSASALVIPTTAGIILFSDVILKIGHSDTARIHVAVRVMGLLALGYGFNGLARGIHALQLASGRPGFGLKLILISTALYVPFLILSVPKFGLMGAALPFLIFNFCSFFAFIVFGSGKKYLNINTIHPVLNRLIPHITISLSVWFGARMILIEHNLSISAMLIALLAEVISVSLCVICCGPLRLGIVNFGRRILETSVETRG